MRHNETGKVTLLSRIVNWIMLFFYWQRGSHTVGRFPQGVKKFVIAGAPRTSS